MAHTPRLQPPSARRLLRYFAVDGGAGAHLLAALSGASPFLQPVVTPRQADLLVVAGPVTEKLAPAVAALAQSVPRPARALVVETSGRAAPPIASTPLEAVLVGARQVTEASVTAILQTVAAPQAWPVLTVNPLPRSTRETIRLPGKAEREIATELAVLSLGPVLPFTAGPVRLLVVCDGEQIVSVQVEAGYAAWGIASRMITVPWRVALELAAQLDPLAPLIGQLAYATAVEQLQGWTPDHATAELRGAALALERAGNQLWWLVRFAQSVGAAHLADRAYGLASAVAALPARLWPQPVAGWVAPQTSAVPANGAAVPAVRALGDATDALLRAMQQDRALGLRTANLGVLALSRLQAVGVTGPVLEAALHGPGDVRSRLVARLRATVADLGETAERLTTGAAGAAADRERDPAPPGRWVVPTGAAHIQLTGPRGTLGLDLESNGGAQPTRVVWQRPSAMVLALLPEWLTGQKLADAETILASLDLAMAEAEG